MSAPAIHGAGAPSAWVQRFAPLVAAGGQVLDLACGRGRHSRLLAMQGMQILFVPFLTDTQNGYMRVRRCAQARAIENECYVAIAGSVGNLPKVENMDIQFAQSAVFTPSDFAFPTNGIKSEATPNTEMTLIVDVDRDLLKELNAHGSVRIMRDRRTDLYELKLLKNAPAAAKPPRRKSASSNAS